MTTIALIGTGVVGERIIKQALNNEHFNIIAIFDEQKTRLDELASKYEVPVANSVDDVLALRPDWVYIGTPPASHAQLTEKIAELGLHIISEKPLAHDISEGQKMVAAVEEANILSAMHFPLMYSDEVQQLKQAIKQNELGEIMRIELHTYFPVWPRPWQQNDWIGTRKEGGFIREIFPHYLQLTNHLFGSLEIIAHKTKYPENEALCETGVTALAQTETGIPLLLNGLSGIAQEERIDYKIFGTKKTLTLRNWSELIQTTAQQSEETLVCPARDLSFLQACHLQLAGQDALVIPFEEGLKVQWWIEELLK